MIEDLRLLIGALFGVVPTCVYHSLAIVYFFQGGTASQPQAKTSYWDHKFVLERRQYVLNNLSFKRQARWKIHVWVKPKHARWVVLCRWVWTKWIELGKLRVMCTHHGLLTSIQMHPLVISPELGEFHECCNEVMFIYICNPSTICQSFRNRSLLPFADLLNVWCPIPLVLWPMPSSQANSQNLVYKIHLPSDGDCCGAKFLDLCRIIWRSSPWRWIAQSLHIQNFPRFWYSFNILGSWHLEDDRIEGQTQPRHFTTHLGDKAPQSLDEVNFALDR